MSELVIDNDNYRDYLGDGREVDFGGRTYSLTALPRRTRFGECGVARAGQPDVIIPSSEWRSRIDQKDEEDSWLYSVVQGEIPCMDQNGLGYCHAYCAVMAVEAVRFLQGHAFVQLSAESIGGPITGWRNQGAHPEDDLQQFVDYGACPSWMMDRAHSISPSRWNPAWEEERKKYRVQEWWDIEVPGRSWEYAMTCTLLGIPYFLGLSWWGHAIVGGYRARWTGSRFEILHRNSWGEDYGEDGYFWLPKEKGTADIGQFAPMVATGTG